MAETIKNLQMGFGLIIALVVLGWCVWRMLIFFGLITIKKAKAKSSYRLKDNKETNHADQVANVSKGRKSTSTISRQALYSSRKHLD